MKENQERKTNIARGKEPLRLVALSDGLFATVLTLLALDLKIPDALNAGSGNVTVFLKWVGPHLFSYLLTFLVAGTYWQAHHRDFDLIDQYDRGLLGYNLIFLLFIGLFPFTTATVSLPSYKSNSYAFYWAIYSTNIILAGIMLTVTWIYAVSHHLVSPETTQRQSQYIIVRQLVTPAVFLISIFMSALFPQYILGPYTLLIIPLGQWFVERHFTGAGPKSRAGHPDWSELMWRAGRILPWVLVIGLAVWAMAY